MSGSKNRRGGFSAYFGASDGKRCSAAETWNSGSDLTTLSYTPHPMGIITKIQASAMDHGGVGFGKSGMMKFRSTV
jgi:hypothetical protein